jgi:hypothetical protein
MSYLIDSPRVVQLVTGRKGHVTDWNFVRQEESVSRTFPTSSGEQMHLASAFLTIQSTLLIKTGWFELPRRCVKCGRRTGQQKFLRANSLAKDHFGIFWRLKKVKLPYCELHSNSGYPGGVIAGDYFDTSHPGVSCVVQSKEFAEEFGKSIAIGEQPPPWVAFSGAIPSIGWGQGDKESWWHFNWMPFWRSMSAKEQEAYANRWQMQQEWRELLFES